MCFVHRVRGPEWVFLHVGVPLVRDYIKVHSHTKLTPKGPASSSDRSPVHLCWILTINNQFQSCASKPSTRLVRSI